MSGPTVQEMAERCLGMPPDEAAAAMHKVVTDAPNSYVLSCWYDRGRLQVLYAAHADLFWLTILPAGSSSVEYWKTRPIASVRRFRLVD